ncbi:flagellar biosynthetic protein FliO [Aquincola sp. MAHUQ-54]|uniref:Flagellar biosynthetic protein FliO n=1 Tax=Aquincola agrisoli TaxID=3119538 RepID=A0AAW9Q6W3_9BURK
MTASLTPLLWFIAILAMIPLALWLLKRSPMGQAATPGAPMRNVGTLTLAPNQRLVTVEVGSGEERRWLVLGITPQSITTLYTMLPQSDEAPAGGQVVAPFAQLMARLSPYTPNKRNSQQPGDPDVF